MKMVKFHFMIHFNSFLAWNLIYLSILVLLVRNLKCVWEVSIILAIVMCVLFLIFVNYVCLFIYFPETCHVITHELEEEY